MNTLWQEKKEGIVSMLVLVGAVLALIALLAGPVLYHADRYRSELRKDARVLQELRAIDAVQEEIGRVQQSYRERNLQDWVYAGHDTDEISLDMQRKMSSWLSGGQLQRMTPVTSRAAEGYAAVGVQVQFTATLEQLLHTLEQIESSRPLLVVERVRLSPLSQRRQRNQPEPPQLLSVQMTVQTYVLAEDRP